MGRYHLCRYRYDNDICYPIISTISIYRRYPLLQSSFAYSHISLSSAKYSMTSMLFLNVRFRLVDIGADFMGPKGLEPPPQYLYPGAHAECEPPNNRLQLCVYDMNCDQWQIYLYCLKCMKFCQLILRKIIKIVATRCRHILRLKCTKFNFGWGSAPDPAGGAYSATPDPLAGFKGAYF